MHIEVKGLRKSFGGYLAANDVSFTLDGGRLIGLLGPSGGGKTTILRMLAGLETPDSGEIFFDGRKVNDVPPQERGIGFVFQSYALFRHMTVFDNIAFGLQVQKRPKEEIAQRVGELLQLTGLTGLDRRYPNQLSGGQRQRVAFARALAPAPRLLLLDEPFAAIDAKVRKELRSWLKETIRALGITTLFVTHDQEEAVEVADEILIVQQGKLEQQGTPADIYHRPETWFVASFIGQSIRLEAPDRLKGFAGARQDAEAKAIIRPEFIELGRPGELPVPHAAERGTVRAVYFRGSHWQIEAELDGRRLSALRSLELAPLSPGDPVEILIHRMYIYEDGCMRMVENTAKSDPMPVHI